MPKIIPIDMRTAAGPLSTCGATSAKYIGHTLVVNPDAKPTNNLANNNIST